MKGFRFYEEFEDKRTKKVSSGTIVAIFTYSYRALYTHHPGNVMYGYDCLCGVYAQPNSPVTVGSVANEHLEGWCKRVSESRAREVHPRLFEFISEAQARYR